MKKVNNGCFMDTGQGCTRKILRKFPGVMIKFYIMMGFWITWVCEFLNAYMHQIYTCNLCFSFYVLPPKKIRVDMHADLFSRKYMMN